MEPRSLESMSWQSKVDFFQREIDALTQKPLALPFQSFLEAMGLNGSLEADKAIRSYAQTLMWPSISEGVRYELCMRLSCARWYCADMIRFEACIDDESTGSEFLEGLLIDYWKDGGRTDWFYATFVQASDVK